MEAVPIHAEQGSSAPAQVVGQRLTGWALAGVLAGLMLTLLLAALDQTIVGTALPRIISELHGFSQYTWVVTAYLLTSTTTIPIVGKLSDQFGRKWFLVAGVIIFLLGSALSGASQTMTQLILFRGLQGIGAGALLGLVFTLLGDLFVPAERARWQGLFAAVFALASVVGPTLGGWITDNANWRWVFYVNLPVGIVALIVLILWLPANISQRTTEARGLAAFKRIDFAGAFTAAGGTVCLLLGLTWGGTAYPWDSVQVIGILVAAAVLFVTFIVVERFFAVEPILPLDLFKNQIFAAGAALSLLVGMALFAVVIYLPLFLQGVLGQSPTNSGAAITPLTLTLAVSAVLVGQLIARIGRYQIIAVLGAIVMAFGIFLMTRLDVSSSVGELTRDMIVVGLGLGMLQPVLTLAVQNAIPRNRLGTGTGAVTYLRAMGQTLGVAIIGTIVANQMATELTKRLPAAARQLPQAALSAATNQQVLINSQYRGQLTQQAIHNAVAQAVPQAVAQAVAKIPPGPEHAARVAAVTAQVTAQVTQQVTQQVTALLNAIFEATRQALAVGIASSFWFALAISGLVIVTTLFLKDVPLVKAAAPVPAPAVASINSAPTGGAWPGPGLAADAVASPLGRPAGGYGYGGNGYGGNGYGGAPMNGAPPGRATPAPLVAAPAGPTPDEARARERLGMAGVMLGAIADEALRKEASPALLAGLASMADGRYPHVWSEADRGRAVAHDLVEPMALAALRAAYGEQLGSAQQPRAPRQAVAAQPSQPSDHEDHASYQAYQPSYSSNGANGTSTSAATQRGVTRGAEYGQEYTSGPWAQSMRAQWPEAPQDFRREPLAHANGHLHLVPTDGRTDESWSDVGSEPRQAGQQEPGSSQAHEARNTAPSMATPLAPETAYAQSWPGHESGEWPMRAQQHPGTQTSLAGTRAREGRSNADSPYSPR
jgi:EmrB/QacA subfamily drug resistance transporter